MPVIAKKAAAHADTHTIMYAPQIPGLIAGADLGPATACRIDANGLVYPCAAAGDVFAGFNLDDKRSGEPVTLYSAGSTFEYGDGLTPNAQLWLAAGGALTTDAAAGVRPVARVVDPKHIQVTALI